MAASSIEAGRDAFPFTGHSDTSLLLTGHSEMDELDGTLGTFVLLLFVSLEERANHRFQNLPLASASFVVDDEASRRIRTGHPDDAAAMSGDVAVGDGATMPLFDSLLDVMVEIVKLTFNIIILSSERMTRHVECGWEGRWTVDNNYYNSIYRNNW